MAIVKGKEGNSAMADDEAAGEEQEAQEANERAERREKSVVPYARPGTANAGYFSIYKSGQGYWTRMGTVGAAALIAFLTAGFFFERMRTWSVFQDATGHPKMGMIVGIIALGLAGLAFWAFQILNRPKVVDFLVATESEMKKVNWTTRQELIGSTKVVILFMFLIALLLFLIDVFFGYFFKFIHVLQMGPFG